MLCRFVRSVGILVLLFPPAVSAAFFLSEESMFLALNDEISYRIDTAQTSQFEQVLSNNEGWASQKEQPFHGTGEPAHIWVKFDVPVVTAPRYVLISIGAWESVECFIVRDGRLVDRQELGMLVPWKEQKTHVTMTPAALHAGFVALDLLPQVKTTVFARLATENRFRPITGLRIALWDADQVRQGELRDRLVQGVFIGAMMILALYNLILFTSDLRELSYLYFVIFMTTSTLVWGVLYGLPMEFLWPDRPLWDFYCLWTATFLCMWSFVQFARHYLQTDKHFPKTDLLMKWISYAAWILLAVYLLPLAADHPISLKLEVIGAIIASGVTISILACATILALLKHHPFVPLFLAALLCCSVGSLIMFGTTLAFIPKGEFTRSASQIGTVLMCIVLSIGLNSRKQQLLTRR
jgi:hypothetical protein